MSEVHGRRLLPSTIDSIAQNTPDHAWASVQSTSSSEIQDVSIAVFANAVNRIAHWIVEKLGRGPQDGEQPVLAYIGASDLRYYVLCMAIAKAGYVPLFISHMNSAAANTSLFEAVDCRVLLCGLTNIDTINVDTKNVNVVHIPDASLTWDPTPVPAFPFTTTYEEAVDKPMLIMHTSGSTGMPKPITITHGWFTVTDSSQDIPDFEGHKSEPRLRAQRSRHFLGFPPFHPAGLSSGLRDSIYFGNTIVFPRADRPIDAACVIDAINHGNIDGAALLPHVLEEMARNEEAVEKIGRLGYIDWVGGPISQAAGDIISSRTTLNNAYASTEIGASTQLQKEDRTLWNWYFFHPKANGFDFRPVPGEDGLHELFVVRQPTLEQPVFRIFPELNEWPTKDLFVAHPTLPHHWRLTGRSDDLIVFQNGSKIHPSAVQTAMQSVPGVKHSLMFGTARPRPGLLIEPKDPSLLDMENSAARKMFLDDLYSHVQQNNQRVPSNGVVIRSLIALVTKEKPLPMTGKGTLQRKAALDLYQEEIDALYEALPQSEATMPDFRIGSGP